MSVVSLAKAVLEADGTLVALATGGIWDFTETKQLGISRTTTPTAYDSNGLIKPCIMLKQRSSYPAGGIRDEATQFVTETTMLECWFYTYSGYTNIESMRDRVYTLLQNTQLTGTFQVLWAGDVRTGFRDTDLDATVERSDYAVHGYKS